MFVALLLLAGGVVWCLVLDEELKVTSLSGIVEDITIVLAKVMDE